MPPHPTQCWVGQWQVDEHARWLRTDHERIPPDSRYPWGKSHFFSNIVWGAGAQHCVGCGGIAWKQYRFHWKRCEKMLILITFGHIYLKSDPIWNLHKTKLRWFWLISYWKYLFSQGEMHFACLCSMIHIIGIKTSLSVADTSARDKSFCWLKT